jgi:hypothetical protein
MKGLPQKDRLAKIKQYLADQPQIKFKDIDVPDEKNPKDFLANFFKHNKASHTVFLNHKVYCKSQVRRSIGDIYRITLFYFPKASLTKLYRNILDLISEEQVLSSICEATGLRVYRACKKDDTACFNGAKTDEFGVDFTQFEEFEGCSPEEGFWGYNFGKDKIKFVDV